MHSICSCPEKSASPGTLPVPDTTLDMRSMDMPEHGMPEHAHGNSQRVLDRE